VELMTSETAPAATVAFAEAWATAIGMVPIRVRREQMGYAFNRLWREIKREALRQVARRITTPYDIDRAWMLTFRTPCGPFGLMDEIGLESVLRVEQSYYAASGRLEDRPPPFLAAMIAHGWTGARALKGFYLYGPAEYEHPEFVKLGPSSELSRHWDRARSLASSREY